VYLAEKWKSPPEATGVATVAPKANADPAVIMM
jgi:hypothetical protein